MLEPIASWVVSANVEVYSRQTRAGSRSSPLGPAAATSRSKNAMLSSRIGELYTGRASVGGGQRPVGAAHEPRLEGLQRPQLIAAAPANASHRFGRDQADEHGQHGRSCHQRGQGHTGDADGADRSRGGDSLAATAASLAPAEQQ